MGVLDQDGFECRFVWGPAGAALAAERGDIVVIVDAFSFSSAVAVAVGRAAEVLPAASDRAAERDAQGIPDAVVLRGRRDPTPEGWSLSPLSLIRLPPGKRLIVSTLNGARCCGRAEGACALFVGALVNAAAVAAAAVDEHRRLRRPVSVVACGERWPQGGALRPSLEDELAAGAIIAAMGLRSSPEAAAAAGAFGCAGARLGEALWECGSGRELRQKGFAADVRLMSGVNTWPAVPVRQFDGWIRALPAV